MGILLLIAGGFAAHAATLFAQRPTGRGYSITDLGTLGGTSSEAAGVNNPGEVVASSTTAAGVSHAFLYRNGLMFDLGTLPGGSASQATAINDRGDIVGYSAVNAYGPEFRDRIQGFAWHRNRCLPRVLVESRLDAQPRSFAGRQLESGTGPQRRRGCRRTLGLRRPLGFSRRHLARRPRHGPEPADDIARLASATGINDRGQIVGAGLRGGQVRAFLLDPR